MGLHYMLLIGFGSESSISYEIRFLIQIQLGRQKNPNPDSIPISSHYRIRIRNTARGLIRGMAIRLFTFLVDYMYNITIWVLFLRLKRDRYPGLI